MSGHPAGPGFPRCRPCSRRGGAPRRLKADVSRGAGGPAARSSATYRSRWTRCLRQLFAARRGAARTMSRGGGGGGGGGLGGGRGGGGGGGEVKRRDTQGGTPVPSIRTSICLVLVEAKIGDNEETLFSAGFFCYPLWGSRGRRRTIRFARSRISGSSSGQPRSFFSCWRCYECAAGGPARANAVRSRIASASLFSQTAEAHAHNIAHLRWLQLNDARTHGHAFQPRTLYQLEPDVKESARGVTGIWPRRATIAALSDRPVAAAARSRRSGAVRLTPRTFCLRVRASSLASSRARSATRTLC
jgi:hypothetical protein